MTALLTENLPLIAAAPGGVKTLRALILDLAVRGKLVQQDPSDEPASTLLKRIAAEKARLVKAGKIRAEKLPASITDAEKPFDIPPNWEWVRLGVLSHLVTSGSRDWAKHYSDQGAIFVRMGNLSRGSYQLRLDSIQRVAPPDDGEGTRTKLEAGDILISITGEVGLLGLIPEGFGDAYINQHTCMVRLGMELRNRFIPEFLRSPFAQSQFNAPQRGIKNSFRLTDVTELVMPIPPLAEQHRIVARVDDLMALCDRLEAQQADAEVAHGTLVKTLLDTLTQSQDSDDFTANWQRLSQHFDTIFTTEASLDALKQTLLQLAVMGKLVRQDQSDESARILLKRLTIDTSAYASEHRIAPPRPDPINEGDAPHCVPSGWIWTRLCSLFNVITDGDHQAPPQSSDGTPFVTISNMTTGKLFLANCKFVPNEYYNKISQYRRTKPGDILYSVVGATYGRPAFVDIEERFCIQRHIAIMRPATALNVRYLLWLLASPLIYDQAKLSTTGTAQPTIPLKPLRNFLAPLPPIAEQHRIVAKVDELMALCDALKARLAESRTVQAQLATALVERAVAA